jgi:hypothetical protein
MNCDYVLLFKYMEGRTTPEQTVQAERMIADNEECRNHYERFKPALDTMRPLWPERETCPDSWNLVQYLYGHIKDRDLNHTIKTHLEQCRFCSSIRDSYEEYRKIPEQLRDIQARDLSPEARKAFDDLKKRYSK